MLRKLLPWLTAAAALVVILGYLHHRRRNIAGATTPAADPNQSPLATTGGNPVAGGASGAM